MKNFKEQMERYEARQRPITAYLAAKFNWTKKEIEQYEAEELTMYGIEGVLFKFSDAAFAFACDAVEADPSLTPAEIRCLGVGFDAGCGPRRDRHSMTGSSRQGGASRKANPQNHSRGRSLLTMEASNAATNR
jgi:hypothetical protein